MAYSEESMSKVTISRGAWLAQLLILGVMSSSPTQWLFYLKKKKRVFLSSIITSDFFFIGSGTSKAFCNKHTRGINILFFYILSFKRCYYHFHSKIHRQLLNQPVPYLYQVCSQDMNHRHDSVLGEPTLNPTNSSILLT